MGRNCMKPERRQTWSLKEFLLTKPSREARDLHRVVGTIFLVLFLLGYLFRIYSEAEPWLNSHIPSWSINLCASILSALQLVTPEIPIGSLGGYLVGWGVFFSVAAIAVCSTKLSTPFAALWLSTFLYHLVRRIYLRKTRHEVQPKNPKALNEM